MGFGNNPFVSKAQSAEQRAQDAADGGARERAWRDAGRLWERAAERENDPKRRASYEAKAQRARDAADGPSPSPEIPSTETLASLGVSFGGQKPN